MGKTTNLGLHTTATNETSKTFLEYRTELSGTGADSNMNIIDKAYGEMDAKIDANKQTETEKFSTLDSTVSGIQSGLSQEISTRASGDQLLQSQIDQIVAPSGTIDGASAAEVENARVGVDATTYASLGEAIRGQVGNLKSDITKVVCNNLIGEDTALYPVKIESGDKIAVSTSDGSIFSTDSTLSIYFYDANKVYLTNATLKNGLSYRVIPFTISNIRYISLSETTSAPLMVNYGDTPLTYEPYFAPIKTEVDKLKNGDYKFGDPEFVEGKYIDYSTGVITSESAYKYAEYRIEAFRGLHITGTTACVPNSNPGIVWYDSNMNRIDGVRNTIAGNYSFIYDVTIPNNASYIRISLRIASENLWTNPVVINGNTALAPATNKLLEEIPNKVEISTKELIIHKRDLSVGNLQAPTFVIGDYNDNVIYYHKIPVIGGSTVRIETPNITGVAEKHYRFGQYYATDGTFKTQTADTTNNTLQIASDCGFFAFSFYCKDSNSNTISNLFTVLPDDFTFTLVYVDDKKETYTDSNDVNTLINYEITSENLTHDLYDSLLQAKRPINLTANAYKSVTQPVVLLHFSDIHGGAVELYRMLEIKNVYSDLIDDVICTGDIVTDRWSDGIDWWTNTNGAEDILIAVGNHDVLTAASGYDWTQLAAQTDQYSRYIAPFVTNWGCTYESGKTYYYKDYSAKKLRLIVLNCMLTSTDDTDQLTWFETTLAGAKTNGYSVVVANHMMIESSQKVDCNFSSLDHDVSGSGNVLSVDYESAIKDFVDGGGKFICHISGHTHYDMIVKGTNDYVDQLCVVVDAISTAQGNQYSDTQRTIGTASRDLANLIVFDTASKVIKIVRVGANMDHYLRPKNCITINYETGDIITEW